MIQIKGLVTLNTHKKYDCPTSGSKVMAKVILLGQTSRSKSLSQKCWYPLIGLVTRNTHVKCEGLTVNVVIFAGGKFHENPGKTFHVGAIFTIFHLFPQ